MKAPNAADEKCRWEGIFYFDPRDRIYADHFPGNPIVPGSLIIHAFMSVMHTRGIYRHSLAVEKFKFIKFIPPGEYSYKIESMHSRTEETSSENRLICTLYDGDVPVANGRVWT